MICDAGSEEIKNQKEISIDQLKDDGKTQQDSRQDATKKVKRQNPYQVKKKGDEEKS